MTNKDKDEAIKKLENSGYKKQGEFFNEFGEQFIIYTHHLFATPLIAGDETDWEIYQIEVLPNDTVMMYTRFLIAKDEAEKAKEIIKKIKK